ncbi:NAD(P)-dependent oxidoreductase [Tropicimonas sp. IMCC34043]|uniref:NAD(P)-dependent oxidoreductase n=1 Tax=Tropicimonas sp. IMCC34043 TaxID=2248760 RepID=UPI000E21E5FE|nr:NAD(P)-dependent oxidoreductase [Tropicimonas sp. IMCC34043]
MVEREGMAESTGPDIALLGGMMGTVVRELETIGTLIPVEEIAGLPLERRQKIAVAVTSALQGAGAERLDLLPGVRRVVSAGAGVDRIDHAYLARRGIELFDTGSLVSSDTAEMAVGLVFAIGRDMVRADDHVRSGRWAKAHFGPRMRVTGKTVGIAGLGRIGRLVAERLQGAGLRPVYHSRRPKPDAPWPYEPDLTALAARSDFLVLAVPGGDETKGMIDAGVLAALGPRGYLVNVSRGTVVDQEALIAALRDGVIAGAALDVFENEPDPDPRLRDLPNTILTPHIAAITESYFDELATEIGQRVREVV